jgi:hypothetical protein
MSTHPRVSSRAGSTPSAWPREVVDEEDRHEEQRRRCDGDERATLRPRRRAESQRVHDDDADGGDEADVRLRLADPQHDLRRHRADLQHVGRARGDAAGERAAADERGRHEHPEPEEDEQRQPERAQQQPLDHARHAPGREREEQVEGQERERALDPHAEVEEHRRVGGLPGVDPGDGAERHQQRAEATRRAPQPPVQPDQQEGGDEVGRVDRRRDGVRHVLARDAEPEGGPRHDRRAAHDEDRHRTPARAGPLDSRRTRRVEGNGAVGARINGGEGPIADLRAFRTATTSLNHARTTMRVVLPPPRPAGRAR